MPRRATLNLFETKKIRNNITLYVYCVVIMDDCDELLAYLAASVSSVKDRSMSEDMIAKLLEKTGRAPDGSHLCADGSGCHKHRWGATSSERARQETPGAFKPLEALKAIDKVIVMGAAADPEAGNFTEV